MKLEYELRREEIEESLYCLNFRREGIWKYVNVIVLTLIGGGAVIGYGRDPEKFFLLWIAAVAVAVMFGILYAGPWRRRRKAVKMMRKGNRYKIQVPREDIQRGYESEGVVTICTSGEIYCIPKRVLSEAQLNILRKILRDKAGRYYQIKTERRTNDE